MAFAGAIAFHTVTIYVLQQEKMSHSAGAVYADKHILLTALSIAERQLVQTQHNDWIYFHRPSGGNVTTCQGN